MDYSRKKTEKEQAYMDAGLPVQQVITDGETPTEKEVRDAANEMTRDVETRDRG